MEYNLIILEDDFSDDIHDSIKVLKALTIRNKAKINLKAKLISLLKTNGYVRCRVGFSISHRLWSSYRPPWLGHKKAPLLL